MVNKVHFYGFGDLEEPHLGIPYCGIKQAAFKILGKNSIFTYISYIFHIFQPTKSEKSRLTRSSFVKLSLDILAPQLPHEAQRHLKADLESIMGSSEPGFEVPRKSQ